MTGSILEAEAFSSQALSHPVGVRSVRGRHLGRAWVVVSTIRSRDGGETRDTTWLSGQPASWPGKITITKGWVTAMACS